MALDNTVREPTSLIQRTTGLLQYGIGFSVIYSGLAVAELIAPVLAVDVLLVMAVGIVIFVFGLSFTYEAVFGDFFFWSAVILHNRGVKGETWLHEGYLAMAHWVHRLSPHYPAFNVEHLAVRKLRFQGPTVGTRRKRQITTSLLAVFTWG